MKRTIGIVGGLLLIFCIFSNDKEEKVQVPLNNTKIVKKPAVTKKIPFKKIISSKAVEAPVERPKNYKDVLATFDYFNSKILKNDVDQEQLKDVLMSKKNIDLVFKSLSLIPPLDFKKELLIDRENALSFVAKSLGANKDNAFVIKETISLIKTLLSKKHSRGIQKIINGDVLDLMNYLYAVNPVATRELANNSNKINRYYKYMLALSKVHQVNHKKEL